ncbi:MAG: replication factor C large subunit [Sulfolobaceae archaeon]
MDRKLSWVIKYRPKFLDEVEDQEEVKQELKNWIESWLNGKPTTKALLIYGPPGVGKSTLAEALARTYGLELLEMNASDSRRLQDIRNIAQRASYSGSLFGKKSKLIFLDEVDGINVKADEGAIEAILELINNTKHPVLLAANDPWDPKLSELRNAVKMIQVPQLGKYAIKRILKKICNQESIKCDDEAIDYIVEQCEGDARYAINMLQAVSEGYGRVTLELVKTLVRRKDRELDPFETLRNVFWAKYAWQAKAAVTSSQIDYELLLRWFSENIPLQYENLYDIAEAYNSLSRASIFLTRAKLVGWDLLSYVFDLMGPGIAVAESGKFKPGWKPKWKKYQFPQYVRELARTKSLREGRDRLLERIGKIIHASKRKVNNDVIPFFVQYYRSNEEKIIKSLNLTSAEIEYLKNISSTFSQSKKS